MRNRETKVLEGLKEIDKRITGDALPPSAKGFSEFEEARTLLKTTSEKLKELADKLKEGGLARTLPADKVLDAAFADIAVAAGDQTVFDAARRRVELRNPPGKENSLGDAINWEYLLKAKWARPVFIISDDSDFQSSIDPDRLHPFLAQEWAANKERPLIKLYRTLSNFLQNEKPEIKIAQSDEALAAISSFVNSPSFASTHAAVDALKPYAHFDPLHVQRMLDAAEINSQIRWIKDDADVSGLLERLRAMHG
jgi:hypothetical protein